MKAHEPELHRAVTKAEIKQALERNPPIPHGASCWQHGHYTCAVKEVERLRAILLLHGINPDLDP